MYHTIQGQSPANSDQSDTSRTHTAIKVLSALGYDIEAIRKALPKLTGLSHLSVANRLGISRQSVTHAMNAQRSNVDLRAQVAGAYGVPVRVMFPDCPQGNPIGCEHES